LLDWFSSKVCKSGTMREICDIAGCWYL